MSLNISASEWNVLSRQLLNQGINSFNVNEIINSHKKILNDFKEKMQDKKRAEIEKFKKELDKKNVKNKEDKILKFEKQKDEELTEKFRSEFFKIAQKIEGSH